MDNGLISRADAIDEAEEWIEAVYCGHDEQRERDAIKHVINGIKKLPSAQPEITPDGTLKVTVDADIASIGRILLSQTGTQEGGLYYKDAQPEGTCESCLHQELEWDEEPCDGCTVGGDTNHYKPSMGRRTDE